MSLMGADFTCAPCASVAFSRFFGFFPQPKDRSIGLLASLNCPYCVKVCVIVPFDGLTPHTCCSPEHGEIDGWMFIKSICTEGFC